MEKWVNGLRANCGNFFLQLVGGDMLETHLREKMV